MGGYPRHIIFFRRTHRSMTMMSHYKNNDYFFFGKSSASFGSASMR